MESNQANTNRNINSNSIYETDNFINMDTFISKLKGQDTLYKSLSGIFRWIYLGLILVYALKNFLIGQPAINVIISDICFIVAAIFFVILLSYYLKVYKEIDYSAPLYQMLKNAAQRYKFSAKTLILVCIPLFIMDIGLCFDIINDPFGSSAFMRILIVQAFYLPMMTASLYFGFRIWKIKQKPLRDHALKMLKDLEN
jgi:hypothetical protein